MRKKIGSSDYSNYLLPAGIVIGGYVILNKLGLFSSGANTDNNTTIDNNSAATVTAALAAAKGQGIGQTVSDAVLSSAATFIYENGISTVDMDGIVWKIIQVNTLTDLLRLIQLFGTKKVGTTGLLNPCYYLGVFCQSVDLGTFLRMCLDSAHIATVNNYFISQSINYSF